MNIETFKAAIRWNKGLLNMGGGEPTIHPLLFDFIDVALDNGHRIWMTTNGKLTEKALRLAQMTKNLNGLKCKLSRDPWHEPIKQEVVNAFAKMDLIHSVDRGKGPIQSGRWKGNRRVVCPNSNKSFVKPDGKVYQCGCLTAPCIGNVFSGFSPLNGEWNCSNGEKHAKHMETHKAVQYDFEEVSLEKVPREKRQRVLI